MPKDQAWRDAQLMSLGSHYEGPIPGLSFVVPKALSPKNNGGDDTKAPGIYLRERRSTSGPNLPPQHRGRLLGKEEALDYANFFDTFAKPSPDQEPGTMFSRGLPDDYYPPTYTALVEAFYEALGRLLDKAITETENRRAQLRETRAAITGTAAA